MFIYDLHQPSTNGTSSWLSWLGCSYRAARNEALRASGMSFTGSAAQQVGTLAHAFLDLYHTRRCEVTNLGDVRFKIWNQEAFNTWEDGSDIKPDQINEALRLVNSWSVDHPWDFFGDDVHSELTVGNDPDVSNTVCGSPGRSWSGRLDLLAGSAITGYYVVDWKTAARADDMASIKYKHNMQLRCYMLAAKAIGYNVVGARVVQLIKTKEPKFNVITLDFPTRREVAEAHAMFAHIEKIRKERSHEKNVSHCFDTFTGKPCQYLEDGTCQRT